MSGVLGAGALAKGGEICNKLDEELGCVKENVIFVDFYQNSQIFKNRG